MAILIQVAWYEVVAIFPTNDRVEEIGRKSSKSDAEDVNVHMREELDSLLVKWQRRNMVRAMIPLSAALVAMIGI